MSDSLLAHLNEAQQQAVQAIEGPVLVLAGPGSGKTRVLTHRIAHLIASGVDASQILAVTFTNKAAREMRERLEKLLGEQATGLTVGTFHSLCARFLRRDIINLGRERDFAIYDSDDQLRLMKRVLKDLNLDEKKNPPRAIHGTISSAKNELVNPQEYARHARDYYEQVVLRCYERYQVLLRESNALDFDDLLLETVRLFDEHPRVLERYQDRYTYLLVDEYQDTNRAQYVLVKQLAAKRRNLFVVGDHDQAIFGWRGANVGNILQFETDYPEARVILLEQNYRSTQPILDVAQSLINAAHKRKHAKRLWTTQEGGLDVTLHEGYDQNEEAQFVASEVARLVQTGEYALTDCAVMYRTNAQSRSLEEAFIGRGLRYQIVGGTRFYERKEVKDVLAYLRLCQNPFDSIGLARVLNVPARGIGERTEDELNRFAATLGVPVFQALREIVAADSGDTSATPSPFGARIKNALVSFTRMIEEFIELRTRQDLPTLLTSIVERLNFQEYLSREYGPDEGEERWGNIEELQRVASEYSGLAIEAQLSTFLEEVALVADVDSLDKQSDGITCITLHQAKGLEYPVVFLVGLEEGLLPHSRSLDDKDQLEEERRLLYVGVTRAQQRLYMLYAFRRTAWGKTNISTPSRFLSDIPSELVKAPLKRATADVQQTNLFRDRGMHGGFGPQPRTNRPAAYPAAPPAARPQRPQRPAAPTVAAFAPGDKVRHSVFGEGIVLGSKLIDGDEEVTVVFGAKGQKKLLASFAKLEKAT